MPKFAFVYSIKTTFNVISRVISLFCCGLQASHNSINAIINLIFFTFSAFNLSWKTSFFFKLLSRGGQEKYFFQWQPLQGAHCPLLPCLNRHGPITLSFCVFTECNLNKFRLSSSFSSPLETFYALSWRDESLLVSKISPHTASRWTCFQLRKHNLVINKLAPNPGL